ncbi:hypothetical protein KM043_011052 [Ampulex compressa]|nr:hypothetical protein KM043_011052 [Ampulex compressa]
MYKSVTALRYLHSTISVSSRERQKVFGAPTTWTKRLKREEQEPLVSRANRIEFRACPDLPGDQGIT